MKLAVDRQQVLDQQLVDCPGLGHVGKSTFTHSQLIDPPGNCLAELARYAILATVGVSLDPAKQLVDVCQELIVAQAI